MTTRQETQAPAPRDGLATLSEAEEFLGVSRVTLYKLMNEGHLSWGCYPIRRKIPWESLRSFMKRNLVHDAEAQMPEESTLRQRRGG